MPDWLQTVDNINAISKGARVARILIIQGGINLSMLASDMPYLFAFATILAIVSGIASIITLRTE